MMRARRAFRESRGLCVRGFTFLEILVAAVVLFVATVGVFQTLAMMLRNSEHHERDLLADQLVRTSIGYMRDVGYDALMASGSAAVAAAIATQYRGQLEDLGTGAALGISFSDTVPGAMLDATVSVRFVVESSTQSIVIETRIAKGGPL
jgi:Tfp pilus assembly protein PilV